MSIVVNTSAAKISAATRLVWGKEDANGRKQVKMPATMYDFVPGILTTVPDDHWKALKEIPLIKQSLDSGVLKMGKAATKVAVEAKKETKAAEEADGVKTTKDSDDSDDDLLD